MNNEESLEERKIAILALIEKYTKENNVLKVQILLQKLEEINEEMTKSK